MTDSAIAALVAELEADHHDADLNYWNRLAGRAAAVLRQVLEQRNRTEKVYAQALHDYNALRDEAAAREVALREALEVIATGSPGRVRSWLISHGYADADSFVEPEYLEAVDVARNILANPSTAAQALAERLKAADKLASKASIVGAVAHIHHWQDELQDLALAYGGAGQAHKEA